MFRRVTLSGSSELFRETGEVIEGTEDVQAEELVTAAPAPMPALAQPRSRAAVYEYLLTEGQARTLADALQKVKYPHILKNAQKLSMEEFERLEALRQLILEGLR